MQIIQGKHYKRIERIKEEARDKAVYEMGNVDKGMRR